MIFVDIFKVRFANIICVIFVLFSAEYKNVLREIKCLPVGLSSTDIDTDIPQKLVDVVFQLHTHTANSAELKMPTLTVVQ